MPNRILALVLTLPLWLFFSCEDPFEETLTVTNLYETVTARPGLGDIIGRLEAITNNGQTPRFSLENVDPAGSISVDGTTGIVTAADPEKFDILNYSTITAEVRVESGNLVQVAEVFIDLRLSPYSVDVITYFKEIALGFEFGGASEITRRWEQKMNIFVGGTWNAVITNELNDIIAELNELITTDFSIEIVTDTTQANFYIFLGSGEEYAGIYPGVASLVQANWGLFSIGWNSEQVMYRGNMYVDIYRASELEQRHLLREELTQSLGLGKDSFRYSDSIFQQNFSTKVTEYSQIDRDLIRLLYHPDMEIGLLPVPVETRLMEILKKEW